ncbi:MAG: hypothetical protein WC241_04115 [Candidatus Paceibacterota bacterium]|jgi:hypothetical protein
MKEVRGQRSEVSRGSLFAALAVIAIAGMLLASCAGYQVKPESVIETGYKTLATSATVYNTGVSVIQDLVNQGRLNAEQYRKAYDIAEKFWGAYNLAVDALAAYKKVENQENMAKYLTALSEVSKILADMQLYIQPFIKAAAEVK